MANTTDYSKFLDGYSLLAIKAYVDDGLATKAPTDHASSASTYGLGTSTNYGHVKLGPANQNGATAADGVVAPNGHTHSQYITSHLYRPISLNGNEYLANNNSSALNFVSNADRSVVFNVASPSDPTQKGLVADVDLHNYKPDSTNAFLDSQHKINVVYIPDTLLGQLRYKGTWNATSPTWPSGQTSNVGDYYICNAAGGKWPDGTTATGKSFVAGDWAIWTGSGTVQDPYRWEKVDNTDAISSITLVSGTALTGAVTIPAASSDGYGLIKIGYQTANKNYAVVLDETGNAYVNVPWTDNNTNYYHTPSYSTGLKIATGSGVNDLYVPVMTASAYGVAKAAAVRSSSITATTGGTTSNRYYGVEIDSNGKLFVNVPWAAGTDTWRNINVNGTQLKGTGTDTGAINFKNGTNVTITGSGNDVTISAVDTTYDIANYNTAGLVKPLYSNTGTITPSTASGTFSNNISINARTQTSNRYYGIEIGAAGQLFVNVPWENTWREIEVNSSSYAGTSSNVSLNLLAGTGITLTPDTSVTGRLNVTIASSITDTKNTVGATDGNSKDLYLIGVENSTASAYKQSYQNTRYKLNGTLLTLTDDGNESGGFAFIYDHTQPQYNGKVSEVIYRGPRGIEIHHWNSSTKRTNWLEWGTFPSATGKTYYIARADKNDGTFTASLAVQASSSSFTSIKSSNYMDGNTNKPYYRLTAGGSTVDLKMEAYTQAEATNILNGLNADGTTI